MKRYCFFLCVILTGIRINAAAQCTSDRYLLEVFQSSRTFQNLVYNNSLALQGACLDENNVGNTPFMLDVYEPSGDTLFKRPCIVYAHGGAFLLGDRRMVPIEDFCLKMAQRGYVVVSIDYRKCFNVLSTDGAIRAVYRAVQDMKAAIRYVKENAVTYRVDTNMIFAAGNSAGSIMAIHSAYAKEIDRVVMQATYQNPDLGCLECSGNNHTGEGKPKAVLNFWGAIVDTFIIRSGDVPMFSVHGTDDVMVFPGYASPFSYPAFPPLYGSVPIVQRLNNVGVVNEFHYLIGEPHEPWLFSSPSFVDTFTRLASHFLHRELLKPKLPVITGSANACTRDTVFYEVNFHAGSEYCWDVQGGNMVSFQQHKIGVIWNNSGSGQVSVSERNLYDAVSDLAVKNITIHTKPTANAGTDVSICMNDSVTLSGTGGGQYLWQPTDWIILSTTSNPVVFPKQTTNYVLRVSTQYCSDKDTVTVAVHPLPQIVSKGNVHLCAGDTVVIEVAVSSGNSVWVPADGLADANSPTTAAFPQQTTNYQLHVTDQNQCYNTTHVTVTVSEKPDAPAINIFENLLVTTSGQSKYEWLLDGVLVASGNAFTYQPTANGIYQLVITDRNNCQATSEPLLYDLLSVNENNFKPVVIYPNPAGGIIRIHSYIKGKIDCLIYDINGKLIFYQNNFDASQAIDLKAHNSGIYFLQLTSPEGTYSGRFVLE